MIRINQILTFSSMQISGKKYLQNYGKKLIREKNQNFNSLTYDNAFCDQKYCLGGLESNLFSIKSAF